MFIWLLTHWLNRRVMVSWSCPSMFWCVLTSSILGSWKAYIVLQKCVTFSSPSFWECGRARQCAQWIVFVESADSWNHVTHVVSADCVSSNPLKDVSHVVSVDCEIRFWIKTIVWLFQILEYLDCDRFRPSWAKDWVWNLLLVLVVFLPLPGSCCPLLSVGTLFF